MAAGSRKQIAFDLSQDALKLYYPHTDPPQNPQFYKKAYADIQRFMTANGFEHRQYSVYTSVGRLTNLDVIALMERMAERFPWLSACVNELDVTNIGVQHSLKLTLEEATRPADMELGAYLARTGGFLNGTVKNKSSEKTEALQWVRAVTAAGWDTG